MTLLEAIDFFDIPEDIYVLKKDSGLLGECIIINRGQYLFFHNGWLTYSSGSITCGLKSTQNEIKNFLLKSDRYKEHLRKNLRKKKLEQINDE